MAKKSFKTEFGGLDALIQPTKNIEITPVQDKQYEPNDRELAEEKMVSVHFRMSERLKIKMEHYCSDNRMKQQSFIEDAIRKQIGE